MTTTRRASRAAHAKTPPHTVLFVCQGNIARSAAAEIIAHERCPLGSGFEFASSGTGAVVGAPVAEDIDTQLIRRGLDVSGHEGKQVDPDMLRSTDLILTMESVHRRWILDEWPAAISKTFLLRHAARALPTVPPADAPTDEYGLPDPAAWLRVHGGKYSSEDQIKDPYRRGADAAKLAVDRVEESLDALLPALAAWRRASA